MTVKQAVSRQSPRLIAACRSGPLSVPAFRLRAVGQFTSTIGDCCYAVALPWLVLSSHSSAASLGVVLACYGVPRVVLTVPAGSLADRCGPRGSKRLAGQRTMVRRRSWTARPQPDVRSVWTLLRQERFLRIALVVSVAANFALIGTIEVTLPALAHARYSAYGFGVVPTCIAAMSIIGALGVARVGDRFVRAALIAGRSKSRRWPSRWRRSSAACPAWRSALRYSGWRSASTRQQAKALASVPKVPCSQWRHIAT